MTSRFAFLAACLLAGNAAAQSGGSLLVNTRLHPSEHLANGQSLQIDLRDYFQFYPPPGPVATLAIRMPVPDGERSFMVGTELVDVMSYKLAAGGTYTDIDAVSASDFEWRDHAVQYRMLADRAPVAVANFMTYAADGVYNNTIVHRNETTGKVFRPSGFSPFVALPIIQAGGFRLYDTDAYLLEWVPTRPAIVFEESLDNTLGTLAMARTSNPDSATSQFFVNLADNTALFGSAYTVFAELLEPDSALAVLAEFANSPVFDLSTSYPNGQPNIFPSLPFSFLPLYTPDWNNKDSFARFSTISVAPGNPDGVSYSWTFIDPDPDEPGISEEEAANRANFDILLEGSILTVNRHDTGQVAIEVTGSSGDQSRSFRMRLVAFEPDPVSPWAAYAPVEGWRDTNIGWLKDASLPWIYHLEHGWCYYKAGVTGSYYLYSPAGGLGWVYITPSAYSWMYAFRFSSWIYYLKDSSDGTVRWFYHGGDPSYGFDGWFKLPG
ncbi:MAG: peptidylprolyl isomerase [Oceanipulchritudo sp.]